MKLIRRSSFLTRSVLLAALCTAFVACVEGPENGDAFFGFPAGTTINFHGKFTAGSEPIRVQVLTNPDDQSEPYVEIWETLETAITDSTSIDTGFGTAYEWSVSATPVPNSPTPAEAARWPEGGLLRFRAITSGDTVLATFDQDREECFQTVGMRQLLTEEDEDWVAIGEECKSEFSQSVLVAGSKAPGDLAQTPKYLSHLESESGLGSTDETEDYYAEIGAPTHLLAFKARFGFGIGTLGSNEVSAVYYNAGDLGTGREMHCTSFTNDPVTVGTDPGVACYVSNYASNNPTGGFTNFSGSSVNHLSRTVAGFQSGVHDGAFATVAMWYTAPITANNSVRFVVYGPNQSPVYEAQLDSKGYNKGIPQNCIVCHGGASYDAANDRVRGANPSLGENGARFLPFDINAFQFSTASSFTRAAQEENFRKLNKLVLQAAPSAATQELIQGWYAGGGVNGVNVVGTVQNTAFIPDGWNDPLSNTQKSDAKIYSTVVAPYCRGCHSAQSNAGYSFAASDEFKAWGQIGVIQADVCTLGPNPAYNHVMPNAEVTLNKFWKSPARAYLAGYFDSRGSCKP